MRQDSERWWLLAGVATFLPVFTALVAWPSLTTRSALADDKANPAPLSAEFAKAIRDGDTKRMSTFLRNVADANARDREGNTPLILAALYAGPDCVELLLKKRADPNAANKAGATALIRAATNYEKARLLLAAGAKARVATAEFRNTPLILAARRYGNAPTVKLLLDHGADVNEWNRDGVSALMAAAASGDLETVRFLLDKRADANYYPATKDDYPVLAANTLGLLGTPSGQGPVLAASALFPGRIIEDDLLTGGRTPLMWAAYRNNLAMIRLLLDHGADPNRATSWSAGTPLAMAARTNSTEAARELLERGAKVESKDWVGFSPLHWASATDSPRSDFVKLLLAKGADPNAAGGDPVDAFLTVPQTPLMLAQKRGNTAIVEALKDAGAKAPPPAAGPIARPARKLPDKLERPRLAAAAEQALSVLQETAAKSRESFVRHDSKQDCTSCHQQYLPMAAVGHARERSLRLDKDAAREQMELVGKLTNVFWDGEHIVQTVFHPEPAHSYGYELFGLWSEKVPPGFLTDVRVHHLATIQAADGRWHNNLPRPPIQSGEVSATALAIQALKHYGWPGRKDEFAACIDRGRQWLWKVEAETNEEAVFQLLGLHWAGESADKLADLAKALADKQRKDGGWSQLPTLGSDAYATGQALYTLAQTVKHPISDAAWQRGLRFLLETQHNDGSWYVPRRAHPFQPTMSSGFPHGRDSWLSAAATSWAVLALTQAIEPSTGAAVPREVPRAAPVEAAPTGLPGSAKPVDFVQHIKPLLERSCLACHGPERERSRFRVDSRAALEKGGDSGEAAILPGKSERSPLIQYVSGLAATLDMPPPAKRDRFPALTKEELQLLRAWVDQGAAWPNGVVLSPPADEQRR